MFIIRSIISGNICFTQLTIPNKVESIGNAAFAHNSIDNIDFPVTLVSLHATAFKWESMNEVICRALSVPRTPQTDEFNNSWRPFLSDKRKLRIESPSRIVDKLPTSMGRVFPLSRNNSRVKKETELPSRQSLETTGIFIMKTICLRHNRLLFHILQCFFDSKSRGAVSLYN